MPYEFKLPDIGEGLHEAEIVRWFVKPGDIIKPDANIAEVQTDKAVVEMTSPVGGTVVSIAGAEGAVITVGETLITLRQENDDRVQINNEEKRQAIDINRIEQPTNEQAAARRSSKRVIAAPSVRKRARELGIDIINVIGSASGGRITMEDLENYLKKPSEPAKNPVKLIDTNKPVNQDLYKTKEDERIPVICLRKKIAEKMVQSKFTAPHVTGMDEIDVTKLVQLRRQLVEQVKADVKLTYLPFIIKAIIPALKKYPYFNSSYDDHNNEIILKKRYNIGIATATKHGLIVPVIKDADQKSLLEIALEIEDLVQKAHEQKIALSDIQDSTFTITSTGMRGGWFATPIINYPEVAIFGAHAIKKRPVVINDDEIVIREMMGISLTFDHRVINGEPSGLFMQAVTHRLENPELLLLDVK